MKTVIIIEKAEIDLFASERSTVPHSGIVDAVLIAEYGKRCEEGAIIK